MNNKHLRTEQASVTYIGDAGMSPSLCLFMKALMLNRKGFIFLSKILNEYILYVVTHIYTLSA